MRISTIIRKVLSRRSGIWGSLCMGVILGMPVVTSAQTTAMPATHAHDGDAAKSAKPKKNTKAADAIDRKAAAKGTAAHSMDHSQMEGMGHNEMEGMDHSQMEGMDMGQMNMQGGPPPPDARDPDYSDGVSSGPMTGMQGMHGESVLASVLIDRLEQFHGDDANGQAVDAQGWVGSDLSKIWFKLDGERSDGRLGATRSEVLWNRAIAPFWGLQTGVRHDFGEGPGRNWAAIGVQGLAPYWFDAEATAYVGESGRTAVRLEAEYEILLTQRLILQPDVELNFYGKDDPAREIGQGLSDLDMALRLRYEITRKIAPYAGVVWSRKFGKTADFARAANGEVDDTQLVAGVRLWF